MSSEINKLNAISFSLIYSKVSPGEKKKTIKTTKNLIGVKRKKNTSQFGVN